MGRSKYLYQTSVKWYCVGLDIYETSLEMDWKGRRLENGADWSE